jgi:hypothetical protein
MYFFIHITLKTKKSKCLLTHFYFDNVSIQKMLFLSSQFKMCRPKAISKRFEVHNTISSAVQGSRLGMCQGACVFRSAVQLFCFGFVIVFQLAGWSTSNKSCCVSKDTQFPGINYELLKAESMISEVTSMYVIHLACIFSCNLR